MAELTEKIKAKGVEDLVIDPGGRDLGSGLGDWHNHPPPGCKEELPSSRFSSDHFPGDAGDPTLEAVHAAQAIAKYAGFIVLDHFNPATIYPLLVLRQNIYTDPQKPIQVQPRHLRDQRSKTGRSSFGHHQLQHYIFQCCQ